MILRCEYTHTLQSGEYSMAITQSIPSYCHSHLLPFLITAPSPFSLSFTFPSAKPPFFSLCSSTALHIIPLLPFLLCTEYPSMPAKNEQNSSGRGWVGGEAGGLTRFYIGLMSLEPQTACSQATDWFQYTSHD